MKKDNRHSRGRPAIGPQITIRLPTAMLDGIAAMLAEGEDRASFIRAAIAREIKRRTGSDTSDYIN